MKIDGNKIIFKSIDDFYFKELAGIKPNTVRFVEDSDEMLAIADFAADLESETKYIEIHNKISPHLYFKRCIRDISEIYRLPTMRVWIFSWFHEENGITTGYNAPVKS
jgi:hypothetical protein